LVDHISPERRSWLMSRVKGKHTSPEVRVRRAAHRLGYRFRLHRKDLPGKPDIVFPKYRVALFVHGCFWHRHVDCSKASTPKSRKDFWLDKFSRNSARDEEAYRRLRSQGWTPVVIWECQTKDKTGLPELIRALISGKAEELSDK
jgi:DNA mismatch endonuclease, patch repair protein